MRQDVANPPVEIQANKFVFVPRRSWDMKQRVIVHGCSRMCWIGTDRLGYLGLRTVTVVTADFRQRAGESLHLN